MLEKRAEMERALRKDAQALRDKKKALEARHKQERERAYGELRRHVQGLSAELGILRDELESGMRKLHVLTVETEDERGWVTVTRADTGEVIRQFSRRFGLV